MAVRTYCRAMTSRLANRCRLILLIVLGTACSNNTGPHQSPPPPPPPPPPGAPTVTVAQKDSGPTGAPLTLLATFADTTTNASPWTYTIDWGDGSKSNGSKSTISQISENHVFGSQASYPVTVSVTNNHGATGTASLSIIATAPVILAAGDIADCTRSADDSTANLLDGLKGIVVPLGDNAYESGTAQQYADCYNPTWGRHKGRTHPVAGNHDYYDTTASGVGPAGYFGYFGSAAGDPSKGYYDYTLGSWLVIVLNTGSDSPPNYAAGSPQEQWLRAELASHSQQCVVAMWHHPRFSSISGRAPIRPEVGPLWDALYQYGAELVLNGHDHAYQRFAPQKPDGTMDQTHGIREIAVGTGGGETLYEFGPTVPNLEVRNNTTHGVLHLTLRDGGYDWKFIPVAGASFTDSGSGTCHGKP